MFQRRSDILFIIQTLGTKELTAGRYNSYYSPNFDKNAEKKSEKIDPQIKKLREIMSAATPSSPLPFDSATL